MCSPWEVENLWQKSSKYHFLVSVYTDIHVDLKFILIVWAQKYVVECMQ